ncbi:outer membrane beta-barrel protein [Fulvivirgaceae bacterium BMA12]|uniref:Outer membrane beta-barrel protein n=1 Tax=Agaribacillus aureus TaxID=3051825 RepID=A0ABT8L5F5_9BACT|nr:outer membrane beta-barrel protein [Fulvivirgaceae bacterium BMA12]
MKYFLTFFIQLILIFNGSAQEFRWGISSSLGVSEMVIPLAENMDHVLKPSYGLGVLSETKLTEHLNARIGLRYTRKGTQKNFQYWDGFRDITTGQQTFKLSFVEVPIAFSLDFGDDNGFILTGGIYYGQALSGKSVHKDSGDPETSQSIVFGSAYNPGEPGFQMKGSDFGYIALIGYKLDDVIVDLGVNASISTVRPDNHPTDKYEWRHTVLKLNVTYFFH